MARSNRKKRNLSNQILIVVQGEKTEVSYLSGFKEALRKQGLGLVIKPKNRAALKLVEYTINISENKNYNRRWCVFDRDCKLGKDEDFEKAIRLAQKNKIEPIYSIQCFEIWILLHFNYPSSSCGSYNQFFDKLNCRYINNLGKPYDKCDENLYTDLRTYQKKAIENSRKLAKQQSVKPLYERDQFTNVYLLVEDLNAKMK